MARPKALDDPEPVQIRLGRRHRDKLDRIAAEIARRTGRGFPGRADAARWAIDELDARLEAERAGGGGPVTGPTVAGRSGSEPGPE